MEAPHRQAAPWLTRRAAGKAGRTDLCVGLSLVFRCWHDGRMTDGYKRRDAEPDGIPEINQAPGMAELESLFAAEDIDYRGGQPVDMQELHRAMANASERRNLELFSPVGTSRDLAIDILREVVSAILSGATGYATDLLEDIPPESPDGTAPTVAGCIGAALGLLDSWFAGASDWVPGDPVKDSTLPPGHWNGEKAATEVLALAGKRRASRSATELVSRHGASRVLSGSALALAAAAGAWARRTKTPLDELIPVIFP